MRQKKLIVLYDKFTQDNIYQILSKSVNVCRLYIKKTFGCVFPFTVVTAVHFEKANAKFHRHYLGEAENVYISV